MTQESPIFKDHPPGLGPPVSYPTPLYTSLALYSDHLRSSTMEYMSWLTSSTLYRLHPRRW